MAEKPTIEDIKTELNNESVKALIAEIRGEKPTDKLKTTVEAIIKADTEKAKTKIEEEKKLQEKIKIAAEKIKEEESSGDTEKEPTRHSERDNTGKFKKKDPDTPKENEEKEEPDEEEEKDVSKIKELTEQMEAMGKEIEALKKRKNYRMKPPKGEKVDEVDDFIKQNITKDFEVKV